MNGHALVVKSYLLIYPYLKSGGAQAPRPCSPLPPPLTKVYYHYRNSNKLYNILFSQLWIRELQLLTHKLVAAEESNIPRSRTLCIPPVELEILAETTLFTCVAYNIIICYTPEIPVWRTVQTCPHPLQSSTCVPY